MPLPVIDLYNTIFPKNKKVPQSPKYKLCGVLPGSSAGLFLVHELLEGNPVLDCDLVAFLNINPFNQSGDDHVPDGATNKASINPWLHHGARNGARNETRNEATIRAGTAVFKPNAKLG